MKRIKKLASLVLAMVMVLAMGITAFASSDNEPIGTGSETGTITINNTTKDAVYRVYMIFGLDSYDDVNGNYSYYIADKWTAFFEEGAPGAAYVTKNVQGTKTYIAGTSLNKDNVAEFAKIALDYAKEHKIAHDAKTTGTADDGTATISGLTLGYYLLDSNVGTVCSLDTLHPNATIFDKNQRPGNEKEVEEDSTEVYGKGNDADITQTVNFQSTITIPNAEKVNNTAGVEKLKFHDKMSVGLTWQEESVKITLKGANDEKPKDVTADNYEVVNNPTDECTFEVVFTPSFNESLKPGDEIVISYAAVLNEKAVVGEPGNPNDSHITYGEDNQFKTTPSETITKTWKVEIFKHDAQDVGLAGAVFALSDKDNNPIKLVEVTQAESEAETESEVEDGSEADTEGETKAEGKDKVYRMAKEGEDGVTEITTVAGGKFIIKGLDSDTYYLTEIEAPIGYNKLANPIKIVIGKDGTVTYTIDGEEFNGVVSVLNQSGSLLPSTGGIGTTIFYVVGGILVVGAGILLVVKKRMSAR